MLPRRAKPAAVAAALLFVAVPSPRAQPQTRPQSETIAGRAAVVDGETLEIRGQRIRLFGVGKSADDQVCARTDDDAWRCGPRALNALEQLLEELVVSCAVARDAQARTLGDCTAGGVDLSLWLIRNGLATAATGPRYAQAEAEAKAARRGMWAAGAPPAAR